LTEHPAFAVKNSKSETPQLNMNKRFNGAGEMPNNDKNKKIQMTKTSDIQCVSFGPFIIPYSNLFRI
jgi:hypothetical protein